MKTILTVLLALVLTHICAFYVGRLLNSGESPEDPRSFPTSDFRSDKLEASSPFTTQRRERRVRRDKKSAEFASALLQLKNESIDEMELMRLEAILFSDWLEYDWKAAIGFKYKHASRFRGASATVTKFMVENANQVMATAMDLEFGLVSTEVVGDLLRSSRAKINSGLLRDFLETSEGSFTRLAMYRYLSDIDESSLDASEIRRYIDSFSAPTLKQTAYEVLAEKAKNSAPEILRLLINEGTDEMYMNVLVSAYASHLSSQSVAEIFEGCLGLPEALRESAINRALAGKTSRLAESARETTKSIDDLIRHENWGVVYEYGPDWLTAAISRGGDAVHFAEWALTLPPVPESLPLYTSAIEPFLKSNPYSAQEWISGFESGWLKDHALAQLAYSTQDTAAWGEVGEWALGEISDPDLTEQILHKDENQ